jgi:hypothetical protein
LVLHAPFSPLATNYSDIAIFSKLNIKISLYKYIGKNWEKFRKKEALIHFGPELKIIGDGNDLQVLTL